MLCSSLLSLALPAASYVGVPRVPGSASRPPLIGSIARNRGTYGVELMMHYRDRGRVNAAEPLRNLERRIQRFLKRKGLPAGPGEAWIIDGDGKTLATGDLRVDGAVYRLGDDVKRFGIDDLVFDSPAALNALMVNRRIHYRHPDLDAWLISQGYLKPGEKATWASNQELGSRNSNLLSSTNIELSTPKILARTGEDAKAANFLFTWSVSALRGTGGQFSFTHSRTHVHQGIPGDLDAPGKLGMFLGRLLVLTERISPSLIHAFRTIEQENNRSAMTWAERLRDQRSKTPPQAVPISGELLPKLIEHLRSMANLDEIRTRAQLRGLAEFLAQAPPARADSDSRALRHWIKHMHQTSRLEDALERILTGLWIERNQTRSLAERVEEVLADGSSDDLKGLMVMDILEDFYKNEFSPIQNADDYRRQLLNLAYAVGKTRSNRGGPPPRTVEFRLFSSDPDPARRAWQLAVTEILVQAALAGRADFADVREAIAWRLGDERAAEFAELFKESADARKLQQERSKS